MRQSPAGQRDICNLIANWKATMISRRNVPVVQAAALEHHLGDFSTCALKRQMPEWTGRAGATRQVSLPVPAPSSTTSSPASGLIRLRAGKRLA